MKKTMFDPTDENLFIWECAYTCEGIRLKWCDYTLIAKQFDF